MSLYEVQLQRDRALACMILAVFFWRGVFLSVFGKGNSFAIAEARKAAAVHEGLLRESSAVLQENLDALAAAQGALETVKKARSR